MQCVLYGSIIRILLHKRRYSFISLIAGLGNIWGPLRFVHLTHKPASWHSYQILFRMKSESVFIVVTKLRDRLPEVALLFT